MNKYKAGYMTIINPSKDKRDRLVIRSIKVAGIIACIVWLALG